MKNLTAEDITLTAVTNSEFGCKNCLYLGCECVCGSKFVPQITVIDKKTIPSCRCYAYFD